MFDQENTINPITKTPLSISLVVLVTLFLLSPQSSHSKSREGYKKEIELRGIAYSRESFLNELIAGNRDIVRFFIKAGIDVNVKNKDGITALMVASAKNDFDIAKLLIKNGADVNAKTRDGDTALIFPIQARNPKIAQLLIENVADINMKNNIGDTILIKSIRNNSIEIAKLLIKFGADVNLKDKNRKDAIDLAVLTNEFSLVEPLIEAGAKINASKSFDIAGMAFNLGSFQTASKFYNNAIELRLNNNQTNEAYQLMYLCCYLLNDKQNCQFYEEKCKKIMADSFEPVAPFLNFIIKVDEDQKYDFSNFISTVKIKEDRAYKELYLEISFNKGGTTLFGQLTANNINKRIALIVNGQVLTQPLVQEKITTGQLRICQQEKMHIYRLYALLMSNKKQE